MRRAGYCVSGPDVDREGIAGAGPALNYAQRRAELAERPATYYVRNGDARPVYRVERDELGAVTTHRTEGDPQP